MLGKTGVLHKFANPTVEVMLGFFSLEGNPLLSRNCIVVVDVCEYCIMREETVRERRGSYNRYVVVCIHSFDG
jgi:hypothetical protein